MQRISVTLPDPVVLQLARKVEKGERSHFVANAIAITKGKQVIAELAPPPSAGFPVSQLAEFLNQLPKLGADRAPFSKALKTIRSLAKLPLWVRTIF